MDPKQTREDPRELVDEERGPEWTPETEGAVGGVAVGVGPGAASGRQDRPENDEATGSESSDPRPR